MTTEPIDMYGLLETIPHGRDKPLRITPDRRYWPNPVSGQFCAHIYRADDGYDEYWYDDEGQPLDGGPAIRNLNQITEADVKAAFMAGIASVIRADLIKSIDTEHLYKIHQSMSDYRRSYRGTNLCAEIVLPEVKSA